ncbi:MAG: lipoyl(octanoyl) transferase LipB [Mariprofundaceae bacterium]|nr:lipoyl(octanoyl) transferase LipB [Mariprofundaceae bacterium]
MNLQQTGGTPSFEWLGRQPYEPVWQRLQARAAAVASGQEAEIIWACEHEPVYTTGRRAVDNREQPTLPAPLIYTDRGGETTFHGPGQLMLYPIIHLKQRHISPRSYVHLLEQSCIELLAEWSLTAGRRCSLPGVWTSAGKIAAIGLRIREGVAYHGMALNLAVKPQWFKAINPCGTGLKSVNLRDYVEEMPQMPQLAEQWQRHLSTLLPLN